MDGGLRTYRDVLGSLWRLPADEAEYFPGLAEEVVGNGLEQLAKDVGAESIERDGDMLRFTYRWRHVVRVGKLDEATMAQLRKDMTLRRPPWLKSV